MNRGRRDRGRADAPGGHAGAAERPGARGAGMPAQELRLFLAVFPPDPVRRAAHGLIDSLRRPEDRVSWVKPENLHYTLRFIGAVGQDGARRVEESAREAAARHAAFDATLGSLGAFPKPERARVIWVGLSRGAEALVAVARDLEVELRRRGFPRADHVFSAHLTLGRPREPGADWTERIAGVAALEPPPSFRVDRISVVQSQLSPKGSIYTVRAEGLLKSAAPEGYP